MKTKYKYIEFVPGQNEKVWTVWNNKNGNYLGTIEFYKTWKEWEFCPEKNTGYTLICLLDLADFIKQLKLAI